MSAVWYSYEKKQWANAVILKDGEIDHYKPGDEIKESAIESYFVWIPRYKYKLKDDESTYNGYTIAIDKGVIQNNTEILNKASPYEIVFEDKNKDIPSNGNTKESWLTHPAFTAFNVNGMWVGKFETGTTLTSDYNVRKADAVQIKPNVYSWRSIQVANAFYTSYDYIRELESHMMKNMEWGAIFYLTYSQYGLCEGTTCTEPRINNNSKYITGFSSNTEPTCGYVRSSVDCNQYESTELNKDGSFGWSYYNPKSTVASTTSNYSGIYDMAGGAWEYVMGVMKDGTENAAPVSGRNKLYNSGFNGVFTCPSCDDLENDALKELTEGSDWPDAIYYDLYENNDSNQQYQRGKLGDATKELGPFYSLKYKQDESNAIRLASSYFGDYSQFVNYGGPLFARGSGVNFGSFTGVGAFYNAYGQASIVHSFRLVLMP